MSQLSHDRLPFGQKFAFSSSHYTSGSHPRFALSVNILPVRHFAVRKLPNPVSSFLFLVVFETSEGLSCEIPESI